MGYKGFPMMWFLFFLGMMAASIEAAPILTLMPSDLQGFRSSTVGWGFTITNDGNYIEITSAQFCINPQSLPACAAPAGGVFNDFISNFNDIIVGPPGGTLPSSVSQNFSLASHTGIGSFAIGPLSPLFTLDTGAIVLTYNITDRDPLDPNAVFVGSGVISANASVLVTLPEPAAMLPVGVVLVGIGVALGKRRTS